MRKNAINNFLMLLTIICITSYSVYSVALEHTTTAVNFNIPSAVEFQVTIPGIANVTSAPTGTATNAIEFNSSSGNSVALDPKVVGTGTVQVSGTPIFGIHNTGTVGLQINMSLSAALPTCMQVFYGTTYATRGGTLFNNTANKTISNIIAQTGYQAIYLSANFTGCVGGDTNSKTIIVSGWNDTA